MWCRSRVRAERKKLGRVPASKPYACNYAADEAIVEEAVVLAATSCSIQETKNPGCKCRWVKESAAQRVPGACFAMKFDVVVRVGLGGIDWSLGGRPYPWIFWLGGPGLIGLGCRNDAEHRTEEGFAGTRQGRKLSIATWRKRMMESLTARKKTQKKKKESACCALDVLCLLLFQAVQGKLRGLARVWVADVLGMDADERPDPSRPQAWKTSKKSDDLKGVPSCAPK